MASAGKPAHPNAAMVIHFKSGKAVLGADNRARLQRFFQKYEIGSKGRVFIVGYTDAAGDKVRNHRLSSDRARAIRREIIKSFGLDATVVMAMGKGEASPVGDNRNAKGRAANRRAEIYLANARLRKPRRIYGPGDPHLKEIQALVQEAETLIKQRQLGEAVKKLKKARALGGDHYADWNATYGIAGFYANAPQAEIHAHLATALRLDPYHHVAREYLSRLTARQNVAHGSVDRLMGDTAENAIPVTTVVQEHEYLKLFKVIPVAHRKVEGVPVDAWKCLDEQGGVVTYYFDHSRIYGWAFAKPSAVDEKETVPAYLLKPVPQKTAPPVSLTKAAPVRTASDDQVKVWDARVFE